MDTQKIAYFVENYSRMSDGELSHLIVTRRDRLTEEALRALETVINERDPSRFQNEIQNTAFEVRSQAKHEEREAVKQLQQARQMHSIKRYACLLALVFGAIMATLGNTDTGLIFCGVSVIAFLYIELHRLVWRFVIALFSSK